ncbi:MAG: hypothetical protein LC632_05680 [Xanthomonadaceae bacterium]|nr:hypothetical protein [Xanthomonadaceae bacterium]
MNTNFKAAAAAIALVLAGCNGSINSPVVIEDGTRDATASQTVNGRIRVGDDVTVTSGSFRSVNGSATVGARSVVPSISVVNGSIRIGEETRTGELSTVNGSVILASRVHVGADINTVNGAVTVAEGGEIAGLVSAVNGRITVQDAVVHGGIQNVNGGIRLLGATLVHGDVVVRRPRGVSLREERPEVLIERGVRVEGRLEFERPVKLRIHREAQVGEIIGAEPEYFGDDDGQSAADADATDGSADGG